MREYHHIHQIVNVYKYMFVHSMATSCYYCMKTNKGVSSPIDSTFAIWKRLYFSDTKIVSVRKLETNLHINNAISVFYLLFSQKHCYRLIWKVSKINNNNVLQNLKSFIENFIKTCDSVNYEYTTLKSDVLENILF